MARRERGSRSNNQQPSEDVDVIASENNDSPRSPDRAVAVTNKKATLLKEIPSLLQTHDTELKQDDVSQAVKSSSGKLDRPCYYFQRGRCKKGARCQFVHERNRKKNQDSNKVGVPAEPGLSKREPTLLAKLLDGDIRKDKSHLLQCFRFFVNNCFLAEWPELPLKFFSWADVEVPSDFRELLVVAKSPESSNFSDVDSEEQLQSETSVLDEPNLQSVMPNACHPESEPVLEDGGESETELESIA
ncbi:hypothetical protein O6H91_06G081700 [Diphasiastrum complanatum]|nr:hypothetical protein O6H91_06G081700 [Diphasiastrum complanatum]